MVYNIYVIASDILVSMLCGAVTILLSFQLRRDSKTQIFLAFVFFECLAEASLAVARVIGLLGNDHFQPFFYLGAILYTFYPGIWLRFVAEYFDLWTPFKRHLARYLLILPAVMSIGALLNILFLNVHISASGSFSYQLTPYAYLIFGTSEACVFYMLILVLRHAYEIKLQAHRQLIFGLIVLFATGLTLPSEVLYRTFGAIGAVIGVLFITGSILRHRLFDPLTQLNRQLRSQTRRLQRSIKQNKKLLEQVKEADAAKTRFIGYISHEVRNPISNIYMTMQNIMEHPYLYPEALPQIYKTDLQSVDRQAQHLKQLIDDLLDIGRIEADALKLTRIPLAPSPVLNDVKQAVLKQLQVYVNLETHYPINLPEISADPVRFTQILNNIIGNAVKFTENGTITLDATVEGRFTRFTVTDTGSGMDEYVLSHLFQPYTQDARELQQPHRGAGLGLFITKRLVELHEGTIQVSSSLNKGTAVSFTIPLAECAQTNP